MDMHYTESVAVGVSFPVTYLLLLARYVPFFQKGTNPGTNPSSQTLARLFKKQCSVDKDDSDRLYHGNYKGILDDAHQAAFNRLVNNEPDAAKTVCIHFWDRDTDTRMQVSVFELFHADTDYTVDASDNAYTKDGNDHGQSNMIPNLPSTLSTESIRSSLHFRCSYKDIVKAGAATWDS